MNLVQNIKGYHVNDYCRCKEFVDKKVPIYSEDTCYLGYGMYFWDNNGNALYWLSQKRRKNKAELKVDKFAKVSANIIIENMLDLTDSDIVREFNGLWEEYCKLENCSENLPFGEKLDRIFDFYKLHESLPVLRVYVKYKYKQEPYFFTSSKDCRLTLSVNQIYSVRDESVLLNSELVEVYEA